MQHADLLDLRLALRYSSRFSTSMPAGGRVLKAHFTWSRCCGRMEQSTIGIWARTTTGAAAKLPAETQPLMKTFHIVRADILR